jgi:HEAT repeat protein
MRMAALLALENGYFEAAFPFLERALRDPSPEVRAFAVDALAASGDPRMITPLQRALFDPEEAVRARVLDNLELVAPEVQQSVLLRALESPDDLIATTAIQSLWEVVTPEVIPPVLRLLDSPSTAKREASQRFLFALFNTTFANRVQAETWWAAHHTRYDELLRPLAGG